MACNPLPANQQTLPAWHTIPASTSGEYVYIFAPENGLQNCVLNQSVVDEFRRVVSQRAGVRVNCVEQSGTDKIILHWSATKIASLIQLVPDFVAAGCDGLFWQAKLVYYLPNGTSSQGIGDKVSYWLNPFDPRMRQDLEAWLAREQEEGAKKLGKSMVRHLFSKPIEPSGRRMQICDSLPPRSIATWSMAGLLRLRLERQKT